MRRGEVAAAAGAATMPGEQVCHELDFSGKGEPASAPACAAGAGRGTTDNVLSSSGGKKSRRPAAAGVDGGEGVVEPGGVDALAAAATRLAGELDDEEMGWLEREQQRLAGIGIRKRKGALAAVNRMHMFMDAYA
jgi:hypothetical protein